MCLCQFSMFIEFTLYFNSLLAIFRRVGIQMSIIIHLLAQTCRCHSLCSGDKTAFAPSIYRGFLLPLFLKAAHYRNYLHRIDFTHSVVKTLCMYANAICIYLHKNLIICRFWYSVGTTGTNALWRRRDC